MDFMKNAQCIDYDPDVFFPSATAPDIDILIKNAVSICNKCKVKTECLKDAIVRGQNVGIWGGATEKERKQIVSHYKKELLKFGQIVDDNFEKEHIDEAIEFWQKSKQKPNRSNQQE